MPEEVKKIFLEILDEQGDEVISQDFYYAVTTFIDKNRMELLLAIESSIRNGRFLLHPSMQKDSVEMFLSTVEVTSLMAEGNVEKFQEGLELIGLGIIEFAEIKNDYINLRIREKEQPKE